MRQHFKTQTSKVTCCHSCLRLETLAQAHLLHTIPLVTRIVWTVLCTMYVVEILNLQGLGQELPEVEGAPDESQGHEVTSPVFTLPTVEQQAILCLCLWRHKQKPHEPRPPLLPHL